MTLFGLPIGTAVALMIVVFLPVASYVLYRIDVARANGYVSLLGYREPSSD